MSLSLEAPGSRGVEGSQLVRALRSAARGELSGAVLEEALLQVARAGEVETGDAARLGALLGMLAGAGVTVDQLSGVVRALETLATPFGHLAGPYALDTCGTGGDGLSTFNLSTATALVAAGCGVPVIKHGNRSVSSNCGSADLLEAIGVPVDVTGADSSRRLAESGFAFLFAPRYHAALASIAPLRRALGVPTAINLAAPLANPARVLRQLVGVADGRALEAVRGVLDARPGAVAYVVHGAVDGARRGADELTLSGSNLLLGVGGLPDLEVDGVELGFARAPIEALACSGPREARRILFEVLSGRAGPVLDAVLLNAAFALVVAGFARDPREGIERARDAIESGGARAVVERLTRGGGA